MSSEETHGVLDEAIRQLLVLHEAVLDARLHAQSRHRDETEQPVFDALVEIRGLDREIRMNVLPRIGHIRSVLRKARAEAKEGRMHMAFVLLDGIRHMVAAPRDPTVE